MRSREQLQFPCQAGTSSTAMFEDDLGYLGSALGPRPIALQFGHEHTRCQWHGTRLNHASYAHFVCFNTRAA